MQDIYPLSARVKNLEIKCIYNKLTHYTQKRTVSKSSKIQAVTAPQLSATGEIILT